MNSTIHSDCSDVAEINVSPSTPCCCKSGIMLAAGLLIGLCVSVAATFGALATWGYFENSKVRLIEEQLHAMATHGSDTMAISTGMIDEGVEGLFVLDFITGELTCQVLNSRTGTLGGMFKQNVVQDLGVEQGKQPKYLIVTGGLEIRQNIGNLRPAKSIVYVADSNTGRWVAYMLPWNQQLANQTLPQASQMVAIGRGSARNAVVE
jgi:hypothetical protein